MPIRVTCPSCGRVGQGPDEAIGRTVQCPGCQHRYRLTADMVVPVSANRAAPKPSPDPDARPQAKQQPAAPAPKPRTAPADGTYELAQKPAEPAAPPPVVLVPYVPPSAGPKAADGTGGRKIPVLVWVGAGVAAGLLLLVGVGAALIVFGGATGVNGAPVASAPSPAPVQTGAAVPPAATNPAVPPVMQTAVSAPTTAVAASTIPPVKAAPGMVSVADVLQIADNAPPESTADASTDAQARAAAAAVTTQDEGEGKTLSTAEIVAESEGSVALVKGKGSSGTGFLIGSGLLATNAHVIDDEFIADLEIRFVSADDSHKAPLKAELLYEDATRDLAFLAVTTDLKPLRIAKTYKFRKGEDITVIGSPGIGDGQVLENAISRGVMSTKTQIDNRDFYQLGIAINPGNSGGPVFDSTGRVIGVATLKASKQEATGFSIPIEDVQEALARLARGSAVDTERYRSRHRINVAVKGLGSGAALLCIMIDLRRANALANIPAVKETLAKLEPIVAELDQDVFPSLAEQAPQVKSDPLVAASVRSKVADMTANFTRLRSAYSNRKKIDDNQLRSWKQSQKRLLTELSSTLKLEIPAGLMAAFDDRVQSQPTVITMTPQNLGSYGSKLRPRAPANPRAPGGPARPPSLRDRRRLGDR